jgi:methylated-DNA-[protein]-cysteine S-methyltransferase
MNANDLKRLSTTAESERDSRAASSAIPDLAVVNGLLDVAIADVDSPIGDLLVAVTPRGLVRIGFQSEDRDQVLVDIAERISPRILESGPATDAVRRELDEYFQQERTDFDVPVDRRLIHGIARDVLVQTSKIGFGHTSTYGEIAKKIGHPTAARAVGRALGSNPIPIVIPCHRVIGASGKLTGYAGGLDRKIALLELEGVLAAG